MSDPYKITKSTDDSKPKKESYEPQGWDGNIKCDKIHKNSK